MESLIELSTKYLLTNAGVQYCIRRGMPLRDVRTHHGAEGTGFVWMRFHPTHVQRFVSNGLLQEIDIDQLEFISRRRAIMAMTRLTMIGVLFRLFRPELKRTLLQSELLDPVRERAGTISPAAVKVFAQRHIRTIRTLQDVVFQKPAAKIKADMSIAESDRKELLQDLQMFVKAVDSETWFYLALVQSRSDRAELLGRLQQIVVRYASRTRIADYLTFLLMELLEKAEYTQLVNFAERDPYVRTHPEALHERLASAHFREKLLERARSTNTYLNLNYHFGTDAGRPDGRPQVIISIANKGLIGYKSRQEILSKKNRNVKRTPLFHFYQEDNQVGDDLGMFYLSYVQEACSGVQMDFDADILRDECNEETVARMVITF